MADLSDLQAAQTIKIAGSNTSGVESAFVSAQTNGTQVALDVGVNVSGVQVDPRQISIVATTAPSTQSNAAQSSIRSDAYARAIISQSDAANAEWGQMFHVSTNTQALTGTTEVALLLFQNPNASGKTAKIYRVNLGPTLGNNYVTYRFYIDPTVTANGTGLTEVGNRQTSQNSTVINAFVTPTVTSNGSLIRTEVNSGLTGVSKDIGYNFSLWIEANHSLLITRQLSANATIGGIDIEWVEQ